VSPIHKLLGFRSSEIETGILNSLNGQFGEQILPTGDTIKWQVRYKVEGPLDKALEAISVNSSSVTSLRDAIDVSYRRSVTEIARRDRKVSIEVTAYNEPNIMSLARARQYIMDEIIPSISADFDVRIDQGGHIRTQDQTMFQVMMAFMLGLGLIYIVLSLSMRNFIAPLLIMGIMPFGAAGMILGHLLLGYTLTLLSIVALIGLFGVLVNDSILLFDEIQSRRKDGEDWRSAVHLGYSHRLRAIVLTSVTTILGLLPLLLETSYQAQFLVPIAITISFGLGAATLASFFLVPAVVSAFISD
jgi:multidrug efflux pump subunit AcrB